MEICTHLVDQDARGENTITGMLRRYQKSLKVSFDRFRIKPVDTPALECSSDR